MKDYSIRENYVVGEKAHLSRIISSEDIFQMANITGDFNPVHLDHEFASQTQFEGCIAHGVFNFGLISAVLGTKLPGPGAIYLNQSLQFLHPVRAGDTLTAEVEVTDWRKDKRIICLKTRCFNQNSKNVAEGEAVLFVEKL